MTSGFVLRSIQLACALALVFAVCSCGTNRNYFDETEYTPEYLSGGPANTAPRPSPSPSASPGATDCLAPYANSTYASYQLLAKTCTVLLSCHPELTCQQCVAGVTRNMTMTAYNAGPSYNGCGLDAQFGFDEPSQPYGWMMAQEAAGLISANSPQSLATCGAALEALSCQSAAVQGAYQAGQPDPFAGICSMIPNSADQCTGVYSGWNQKCSGYVSQGSCADNFVYPAPWHVN